jgi:hypothetical protein
LSFLNLTGHIINLTLDFIKDVLVSVGELQFFKNVDLSLKILLNN